MNPVERALHEELTQLLDRLAAAVPEGGLAKIRATNPILKTRLDAADTNLAQARESVLEAYGRWGRALDDVENLWALGVWRAATAEEPVEQPPALAA